jgi:ParB family transcriptional regulator, chromosome partitioning protein
MQNSSAFQFLALETIHESAANPRRTFEEPKLHELAASIRQHGLIQPITVRPKSDGFEIVAGARRFRAAQLAELSAIPARIVEIDDAQAVEWALVENAMRVDVHPYEEAEGFQRLLGVPGYDVATLVEKSGKSASHIYARLSLLQLIPAVAEAFTHERITLSHANLIARLPQESQSSAFEQCWRRDWKDDEAHLLPAKFLAAWIQNNLFLSLADAPFDREDPTLNPAAGACTICPRRSGYNTALFADVASDECLDGDCYHTKIAAHIDSEIAARPELVQIETTWQNPKDRRPGALQRGQYHEIEAIVENPDAEPALPCPSAKTAIIVYGKGVGTTVAVCTDEDCPVHDPDPTIRQAPPPAIAPAAEGETQEEAQERQRKYEQQRTEYREEQERRAEERKREFQRQQEEHETERARIAALHQSRIDTLDRMVENAPAMFSAAQLRVLLTALINLNPDFIDDVAALIVGDDENNQQMANEVLTSTIAALPDEKLPGLTLKLLLTAYTAIPRDGAVDYLAEAEVAFTLKQATTASKSKRRATDPKSSARKSASKKRVAA